MNVSTIIKEKGIMAFLEYLARSAVWIFSKYVLRRRTMVARVHGSRMVLDLQHAGISRVLATWGTREVDHTQILQEELEPGMTVLDVGANIGYYTLLSASLVGSSGKVIAIEPDTRNIDILRKSISLNELEDTVDIFNLAVSNKNGTSKFFRSNATNLNTLCDPSDFGDNVEFDIADVVDIPVVKLDDFLAQHDYQDIDLVRMDIEGYEVEALEGLYDTLRRAKDPCQVIFEVHPYAYNEEHDIRPVLRNLFSLGFEPKTVVSARVPIPSEFKELGYVPDRQVRDGTYLRGFYSGVSQDDLLNLITVEPKCIRYVLLAKKRAQ